MSVKAVDNPYFQPEYVGRKGNPETITAVVNLRNSTVEYLLSRREIENYHYKASERFREYWETAGDPGVQAIDPFKDVVSGSRSDGYSDRLLFAAGELRRVKMKVGDRGYFLLCMVCGHGLTVQKLFTSDRARKTNVDNLKMHLHDLAEMWGLAGRAPKGRSRIRSQHVDRERVS